MAIELLPSNDVHALANAIQLATTTGQLLVLLPGAHLTQPGVLLTTKIGPRGLRLQGSRPDPSGHPAQILRPDFSIATDPLHRKDDNYGLFFIPSDPTTTELSKLVFHSHGPTPGFPHPFEFALLQRGDLEIGNLVLNCNMGRQNLQPKDAPHSFMLAFSGASYPVPPGTNKKLERSVFISFNSVTLRDIQLKNGGFSDDIRIEPGSPTSPQPREFRPNIGGITITGITGVKRPNRGGNSIRFGGLAQNVLISNCALNSLILEVDPDWSTFPGPSPFQPSVWHVSSIQARAISFNANGPVQSLIAQNLTARQSFTVSHATGQILDSRLVLLANDVQFRTLREVLFQNCAFTLPQPSGAVHGIDLQTHDGLPCSVRFKDCSFTNNVGVVSGQLIRTEARSTILSERVTANLENCLYPTAFTHADKTHHVAILNQKGDYTFLKSDFPNSDPSPAIAAPPNTNIVDHGSSLTYHIP